MLNRSRWLVCALALFSAPLTFAASAEKSAPNIYHVEIILLRNTDAQSVAAETWPDTFGVANVERAILTTLPATTPPANTAAKTTPANFELLPASDFKLTASVAKLKRLPAYEVLLHTAWRQPAIDLQESSAVYVYDGMTFPETTLPPPTGQPAVIDAALHGDDVTPVPPRFSGTVKLALGRYLHVALDLMYRNAAQRTDSVRADGTEFEATREVVQGYRLVETRRIKTSEVHYFDHPAFSALVLVAATEKNKNANVEKETVGADKPIQATPDD